MLCQQGPLDCKNGGTGLTCQPIFLWWCFFYLTCWTTGLRWYGEGDFGVDGAGNVVNLEPPGGIRRAVFAPAGKRAQWICRKHAVRLHGLDLLPIELGLTANAWPVLPFKSIIDYPKRASSDWLRNKSRGLCLWDRLKPNCLAPHITCLIPRLASIGRGHSKFSWKWKLPMWKAGLTQSSANKVTGHIQGKRTFELLCLPHGH